MIWSENVESSFREDAVFGLCGSTFLESCNSLLRDCYAFTSQMHVESSKYC